MQLTLPVQLPEDETFASFYAKGNERLLSHLAQLSLMAQTTAAPITAIHGPPASGKSHLLYAMCHQSQQSALTSCYINFREYPELTQDILEGIEQHHVICLDNIDCIADNLDWQQALFDLINRVIERYAKIRYPQLIVTSETPAGETPYSLPDLASRLRWGWVFGLSIPNDEVKRAIIALRAKLRGLKMSAATINYLLNHGARDLPSLLSVLDTLDDLSLQYKSPVNLALLKQALVLRQ